MFLDLSQIRGLGEEAPVAPLPVGTTRRVMRRENLPAAPAGYVWSMVLGSEQAVGKSMPTYEFVLQKESTFKPLAPVKPMPSLGKVMLLFLGSVAVVTGLIVLIPGRRSD